MDLFVLRGVIDQRKEGKTKIEQLSLRRNSEEQREKKWVSQIQFQFKRINDSMQSSEEVFEALGQTLRSYHAPNQPSQHYSSNPHSQDRNLNAYAKMSLANLRKDDMLRASHLNYDSNNSHFSPSEHPNETFFLASPSPLDHSMRSYSMYEQKSARSMKRETQKGEPVVLIDRLALEQLLQFVDNQNRAIDKLCLSMIKKEGKIQEIKALWRKERDERRRLEKEAKQQRAQQLPLQAQKFANQVMKERKTNNNVTLLTAREYLLNDNRTKRANTPILARKKEEQLSPLNLTDTQMQPHLYSIPSEQNFSAVFDNVENNPIVMMSDMDESAFLRESMQPGFIQTTSHKQLLAHKAKRKISISSYTPTPNKSSNPATSRSFRHNVSEFCLSHTPGLSSRSTNEGEKKRIRQMRQSCTSREAKYLERTISALDCRRSSVKEDLIFPEPDRNLQHEQALKAVGVQNDSQLEKAFNKYAKGSLELDQIRRKNKKYKVIVQKLQELTKLNEEAKRLAGARKKEQVELGEDEKDKIDRFLKYNRGLRFELKNLSERQRESIAKSKEKCGLSMEEKTKSKVSSWAYLLLQKNEQLLYLLQKLYKIF